MARGLKNLLAFLLRGIFMSLQRLVIDTGTLSTAADFKSVCNLAPGQLPAANNFLDYIGAVAGGLQKANMAFNVGAVKATATFTFASTGPTNGQTCTICGVTFTAVTSGATGNQFNINSTPATVAANLVTAINAATSMSGIITASALSGVVTLSAVVPGLIGNGLVCANVNLSNTTVASFLAVNTASDGTAYTLDLD
jgi:hypothetical protein